MALPVLNVPMFEVIVPSTKKPIKCRPFLVKEEKILLMAMESENNDQIVDSIKQIMANCIVELGGHKIENFAFFDLEFIFLKLRSKSKGERIELKFDGIANSECVECRKPKVIGVNLNDIQVKFPEKFSNKIELTKDVGLIMKYPQFSLLGKMKQEGKSIKENSDVLFDMVRYCIESIYDKASVYNMSEVSNEEYVAFVESLTTEQFEKVQQFFELLPELEYDIDLGCSSCGRKDVQTIRGLQSFFQ